MVTHQLDNGSEADFLIIKGRVCANCWHKRFGSCEMQSIKCATDIAERNPFPAWWTSYEAGTDNEIDLLHSSKKYSKRGIRW